jgi:hypothetical protein
MSELTFDRIKKAVANYESSRSLVRELKNKRSKLIHDCELNDGKSSICLVLAWDENLSMNEDNGEMYDYCDVLSEGVLEGKYCHSCLESYELKKGPLAEASKNFGNAKRALSRYGAKILGDSKQPAKEKES